MPGKPHRIGLFKDITATQSAAQSVLCHFLFLQCRSYPLILDGNDGILLHLVEHTEITTTKETILQYKKKQCISHIHFGMLLLFSSLIIVEMNILLLRGVKEIVYPFYLIYGVSAYAFYSVTIAIINVIKYKKTLHPVFLANKNLSLVVAMISMLSMQSALLTAFCDDDVFSRNMSIITGFAFFSFVVALSVLLIVFGQKQYKQAYNN